MKKKWKRFLCRSFLHHEETGTTFLLQMRPELALLQLHSSATMQDGHSLFGLGLRETLCVGQT